MRAVSTRPAEVGQEHHPAAVAAVGEGAGDHPEEEVRQHRERTDDAHHQARPGQRQDEQRQRREAHRVAERRDALRGQQDPEIVIATERQLVRAPADGTGRGGPRGLPYHRCGRATSGRPDRRGRSSSRCPGLVCAAGRTSRSGSMGERLAITPRGRRKDELANGTWSWWITARRGRAPGSRVRPASSDSRSTSRCPAARADVGAMVHAHLPASMALTLAGEIPDPAALPETALFIPRLPFVPFGDGQRRSGAGSPAR